MTALLLSIYLVVVAAQPHWRCKTKGGQTSCRLNRAGLAEMVRRRDRSPATEPTPWRTPDLRPPLVTEA